MPSTRRQDCIFLLFCSFTTTAILYGKIWATLLLWLNCKFRAPLQLRALPLEGPFNGEGQNTALFSLKRPLINNLFMHPFHCSFNNSFHNSNTADLSIIFGIHRLLEDGDITDIWISLETTLSMENRQRHFRVAVPKSKIYL